MRDKSSMRTELSNKDLPAMPFLGTSLSSRKLPKSKTAPDVAVARNLETMTDSKLNMSSITYSPSRTQSENTKPPNRQNTIRSVPSEQPVLITSSSQPDNTYPRPTPISPLRSHTHNLPLRVPSPSSTTYSDSTNGGSDGGLSVRPSIVRTLSGEFTRSQSSPSLLHTDASTSTLTNGYTNGILNDGGSTTNGTNGLPNSISNGSGAGWTTAVGKANLGKSGRVIEKLQNTVDTLRREIASERANTAEYKDSLALAESKNQQMRQDHEMALHNAAVAQTSLKRRERQLADLKGQVDIEKDKAEKAVEREQGWKDQVEQVREECQQKIAEAQLHAAMMDGRVTSMTSHWTEQQAEIDKSVAKLRGTVTDIHKVRKGDLSRVNTLNSLCDQNADQLDILRAEKEAIFQTFEAYKAEQDAALREIKEKAKVREEEHESMLKESQEVLGQLKWALNVQKNVKSSS